MVVKQAVPANVEARSFPLVKFGRLGCGWLELVLYGQIHRDKLLLAVTHLVVDSLVFLQKLNSWAGLLRFPHILDHEVLDYGRNRTYVGVVEHFDREALFAPVMDWRQEELQARQLHLEDVAALAELLVGEFEPEVSGQACELLVRVHLEVAVVCILFKVFAKSLRDSHSNEAFAIVFLDEFHGELEVVDGHCEQFVGNLAQG